MHPEISDLLLPNGGGEADDEPLSHIPHAVITAVEAVDDGNDTLHGIHSLEDCEIRGVHIISGEEFLFKKINPARPIGSAGFIDEHQRERDLFAGLYP